MVQGYYTLEEAARILGMATEDLSHMAQRREVRAFADRGTWRFRTQDIEELARRRGQGSNPDLPLGEAPRPQPHDTPTARTSPEPQDEGVFNFGLGTETEHIDLGPEAIEVGGTGSVSGARSGSKSDPKRPGSKSPPPKPGSDSDVRLVPDGSNVVFEVSSDSDIKLVDDSASPSKSDKRKATGPKADSGAKLVPMDPGPQSPVRLTPSREDESAPLGATPIKTSSDSDVRLEAPSKKRGEKAPEDSFLTEEIDLDAELRRAEEAVRPKKPKPTPVTEPFELSEADLDVPKRQKPPSSKKLTDSSSDFGIPATTDLSERRKEEEISLEGGSPGSGVSSGSGVNLGRPTDSGISLEPDTSDEIELEPHPRAASRPATPSKSEKAAKEPADSSSEFELTLEDSGRLAPLEDETASPAAEGDKDIFETDFEVPALDESGSQAMALDESDTDLESSDFDLALGEDDVAVDEESGSQVVALDDEEEVDESAATVARPGRRGGSALVDEDEAVAEEDLVEEEEVAPSRRAVPVAAAATTWGVFTPVVLLFSFFVLFLLGLMSFELLRGMWGYHQATTVASPVVRGIAGLFYDQKDLPTD
jgi:hypothetical protein